MNEADLVPPQRDEDHVETAAAGRHPFTRQKDTCGPREAAPLGGVHGPPAVIEGAGRPRLDLDEHQERSGVGDEVDLAPPDAEPPSQDAPAEVLQEPPRRFLSALSASLFGPGAGAATAALSGDRGGLADLRPEAAAAAPARRPCRALEPRPPAASFPLEIVPGTA